MPHPARSRRSPYARRRAVALASGAALIAGIVLAVATGPSSPNTHGARIVRFSINSRLVHQRMAELAVVPPGRSPHARGLLVFLHGKGENQESNLVAGMFAALTRLGANAPDVVFPDGGSDSYWHDRRGGNWGRYVFQEVIPQTLQRLHADPHRVAIAGLSMGGFGAYDIARLHRGAFCAVGADSAALWRSGGESAAGAFDNAEDFARHDLIGAARSEPDPYPGARLWLDVGTEDPFRSADSEFVASLRARGLVVDFHVWPGGHDQAYWSSHWASYLGFYARALAACR